MEIKRGNKNTRTSNGTGYIYKDKSRNRWRGQVKVQDNPRKTFQGETRKEVEKKILSNLKKKNYITLSDKKIKDVIPYLCISNMYVGNDSFGSHITSQSGKKSIVILLDSPRAYTDYSKNYYRVIPRGFTIDNLTHGSNANPNLVTVDQIIDTIMKLRN